MNPGEEFRSEGDGAAIAGATGAGSMAREVRETGGQVVWAVGKVLIIILAALLGAMTVEGVRALL
jgi:hypothetical protein